MNSVHSHSFKHCFDQVSATNSNQWHDLTFRSILHHLETDFPTIPQSAVTKGYFKSVRNVSHTPNLLTGEKRIMSTLVDQYPYGIFKLLANRENTVFFQKLGEKQSLFCHLNSSNHGKESQNPARENKGNFGSFLFPQFHARQLLRFNFLALNPN